MDLEKNGREALTLSYMVHWRGLDLQLLPKQRHNVSSSIPISSSHPNRAVTTVNVLPLRVPCGVTLWSLHQ